VTGVRQFDTEKALEDAMRVFWDFGYDGTSMTDLTDATGLGRSSLYGAFGNKEGLFLAVLEHYITSSRRAFYTAMELPEIRASLRAALEAFVARLTHPSARPGCLTVLAADASEGRSNAIRRRVIEAFAQEEKAFYERFRKAQIAGELAPAADPRALARFFSAQTRALGVIARVSPDPVIMREVVDVALTVLDGLVVLRCNPASEARTA
jgi:TetR/AcrR family transcriptional regulator, transcriptional repressor for nem operon